MADKGRPLPKFGEWDVNDPSSAEGFTVIFNKARNEKKTGGKVDSPGRNDPTYKQEVVLGKPQSCLRASKRNNYLSTSSPYSFERSGRPELYQKL